MTEDYCKLASGIILSTVWQEDDHTRILWITMLAIKARDHRVLASVPGLASVANIPLESCRASLVKLMAPDPDSRTKEHEGRRIAEVDGGWLVLNGEKYRNFLSKQERNEYQARLMAQRRAAEKLAPVSRKLAVLGQAEAEAEANKKQVKTRSRSKPADDATWRQGLLSDPAYRHINISAEFSKCQRWCERKKKPFTQARFEAWLNRIEAPITGFNGHRTSKPAQSPVAEPAPELTDEQIAKNQEFIRNSVAQLKNQLSIPS